MMKKYIIDIGILAVGLVIGWLLFGGTSNTEIAHNHNISTETNQMWTCSMHPQIMRPEAGDCPICGMDLIPAASASDGLLAEEFKLTEKAMALASIQTSIVGNRIAGDIIKLSGKLTVNKNKTATQPAHYSGRIEELYVNSVGETVRKGQAIAQVYSSELVAAQQELITTFQMRESQPQLYQAVRNKFKNWKIHDSQLSEIETTGQVKTSFTIYSHVAGVVSEIIVNQGAHIMDGHPVFKVANLATVWANFDVYEHQIDLFKKGQAISVITNVFPNKEFKAKVDFIDPVLDSRSRTVKLRVVLDNNEEVLKPGMFVEGKIKGITSSKEHVLTIPSSAVLWTGERSVVYLKTNPSQPVFEMRKIALGNQIGTNYEVLEGLNVGDEIVTNGVFTIDAAAQLQGKKSMMNNSGGQVMTGHQGHFGMEDTALVNKEHHFNRNERIKVPINFQNQLKKVFNDYIKLKEAFVKDDSNKVMAASKRLLDHLFKVDMKLFTGKEIHNHWVLLEKEIKEASTSISNSTEIAVQRNHFKDLSLHLIHAIEVFGVNEKVYRQFCPMANNNKGAYWLSRKEKVLNPYFGRAMLSCGEAIQIIE